MTRKDQMSISGSFGPNVVITRGSKRTINIAGGANSGDVYQDIESSAPQDNPFAEVSALIREEARDLQPSLSEAVRRIEFELQRGPDADVAAVQMILWNLQSMAPRVLEAIAKAIVERTTFRPLRDIALEMISRSNP